MPAIRYEQMLAVPPTPIHSALGEILQGIADQDGAWKDFALHASLGEAGLPDVGYLAVPIHLTIGEVVAGVNQFPITIRAAKHPESFPVFEGSVAADMSGNSGSMLSLGGNYDVPLGVFGSLVNAGLVRGLAEHSLQNFLADIAMASVARVERREAEYVRYIHGR
ncbi:MAG: hypothetical protein ABR949_12055 [Candidatus Aquilonibacter sp.]|jgi:hypothetical protein